MEPSDRVIRHEDSMIEEVRNRFWHVDHCPYTGKRIFLDSASGSLRLRSMVQAMTDETALPDQLGRANPGSKHADQALAKGLEDVKLFMGGRNGFLMPALSSTHAMFSIVNAILSSTPGSNVVTTDLEHPAVFDSTRHFADVYGKEWRVAHLSRETGSVPVGAILDKVDKGTSLVAFIHASNITGAILDVGSIVREVRKVNPNIFVVVDGVQYAPHAPIDVERADVDGYVFGPYKVYCAKGIGFAYLNDRLARLPHWKLQGKPETDWTLGSIEHATFAAWSAVVDYICWLGRHFTDSHSRREQIVAGMKFCFMRVGSLLDRVLNGTENIPGLRSMEHVEVVGMEEKPAERVCLVAFNIRGIDARDAVLRYLDKGVAVHERTRDAYSAHVLSALGVPELVRLSACHYNTFDEIDTFLEVTESMKV
jgi:cysteine desulfurase/selenocysteine lyase